MSEHVQGELKKNEYPGKIMVAEVRGNYPGCAAVEFATADEMNAFFEGRPNRLVTYVATKGDKVFVLYTKTVTDEELREQQEVQHEVRRLIDERHAKRDEAELKAQEAERLAARERERLVDVGRKCEENHAKAIAEKREAKKGKK